MSNLEDSRTAQVETAKDRRKGYVKPVVTRIGNVRAVVGGPS